MKFLINQTGNLILKLKKKKNKNKKPRLQTVLTH